jgi:hypothetical protein
MADDGIDGRALNRANWDDRVPIPLASTLYDLAGFGAGASPLRPFGMSEVGSVPGGPGLRRYRSAGGGLPPHL